MTPAPRPPAPPRPVVRLAAVVAAADPAVDEADWADDVRVLLALVPAPVSLSACADHAALFALGRRHGFDVA